MSTLVRRFGIAVALGAISFAGVPASAQELSFGYQWQWFDVDVYEVFLEKESLTAPLGFNFDVAGPITSALDVFGQFDWSRQSEKPLNIADEQFGTTVNFTTFGAGLRWSLRANPAITPFVQGLFGLTHTSVQCEIPGFDCEEGFFRGETSSTDPVLQIGGGVAIPLGNKWSALGQFDWRRIFGEDEGIKNSVRFVTGVRFGIR